MAWKTNCALWLSLGAPLWAQLTYPGCSTLGSADFETKELFNRRGDNGAVGDATLSEPTRMDVQVIKDASGAYSHTNIYFVQRKGQVKLYDGLAKRVTTMGTIATRGVDDNGLMGLALHPDFAANRWIYFWYSPVQMIGQNRQLRLTRIAVKPDNTLDMASEKILINIVGSKTDTWHSGGPMQFDSYGDLWIAIGNNGPDLDSVGCNVVSTSDSTSSAEWGSSSTANMRGGFIRIHPDSSEKGYSIPRGNFGEYWADQFEKLGKPASLVADYRNPAKVLPEIYVKGERSNYSISVHPTKRWLAWGTVNFKAAYDEFNITRTPIFSGYPYFHANNVKTCPTRDFSISEPKNTSPFNQGVQVLPPAVPGTVNNLVNVAIGGPLYAYDPKLASPEKFPPHFDNTWILAGFGRGGPNAMWAAKLDTATLRVSGAPVRLDPAILPTPRNFVQAMYGAEGALYILNYDGDYNVARNPGVMRITYKGSCAVSVPEAPYRRPAPYLSIWMSGQALVVAEPGDHEVSFHELDGRLRHRESGHGRREYRLPDFQRRLGLSRGAYLVRVKSERGTFSRHVPLL